MKNFSEINRALGAKKKFYSFLLMLLMAVMSISSAKAEYIAQGDGWNVDHNNNSYILTISDLQHFRDYDSSTDVAWAAYSDQITAINFQGAMVTPSYIGLNMFANMPNLKWVMGNQASSTRIGRNAFRNCPKLEWLSFADEWTSVGEKAFENCTRLEDINASINGPIDKYAFHNCYNLNQSFDDCTSVGDYAFQDCSSLRVAQFSHITSIGKYAFAGCSSLERMQCLSGVNSYTIGERAFDRCSAMYQADVQKATSIGDNAFINCYALKSIELTKCKTISQYAFRGCDLETITIGSSIESIGDYAFYSAINDRAHIYMNSSFPPTTGTDVFSSVNCSTISLHVPEGCESAYNIAPWSAFRINPDPFTIYGVYNGTKFTIYYDDQMDARGGIEEWWWETNRKDVTSAVLDASLDNARPTSTERWFYGFEKLTSITNLNYLHTDKVTDMYGMFSHCTKLTSIDLANFRTSNVTNFSDMFIWCESLTEIDVNPLDLSSATKTSFMFGMCTNLEKIYCDKDWTQYSSQITLKGSMFDSCTSLRGGKGTEYNSSKIGLNYARPDGGSDAPGYFWRADDDGLNHEDIENVQTDKVQSTKVIRDGQLLIERNGKTYNANGVEIK